MTMPSIHLDPRAKDSFSQVVVDCLIEFHGRDPAAALSESNALRQQVEQAPLGICGDVIYHDEPFDVACDLAGTKFDLAQHRSRYDLILQRHNW
jgi:hypothetical protein